MLIRLGLALLLSLSLAVLLAWGWDRSDPSVEADQRHAGTEQAIPAR